MEIEKRGGNGNGKHVASPASRSRGRSKSAEGNSQLHITLTESLAERLDFIKRATHASTMTETIKAAILLTAFVVAEHQAGGRLYMRRDDEELERQIQLFL